MGVSISAFVGLVGVVLFCPLLRDGVETPFLEGFLLLGVRGVRGDRGVRGEDI